MATYCVTFRISNQTINGRTYDERRNSVVLNTQVPGQGYWDETTSFILCESDLLTAEFAAHAARGLDRHADLLVAFDPEDMSMAAFGNVEHFGVLSSFFDRPQRI